MKKQREKRRRSRAVLAIISLSVGWMALMSPVMAAEKQQRIKVVRLKPEVKASINRGLAYLASTGVQNEDGSWGASQYAVANTSLSLMAFMVQGHVPGRGKYGRAMDNGLEFLLNVSSKNQGYLGVGKSGMYQHGFAVLALSEAWGQSKDPRVGKALRRAVDITLRAQSKMGGWRYSPSPTDSDISCTVMHLVALNSARESGIAIPDASIQRAAKYVIACESPRTGGFGYTTGGGADFSRSAAGVMSLIMCDKLGHKATQNGLRYLKSYPDSKFENVSYYYYGNYYAIQAMYQASTREFNAWYPKITKALLSKQAANGAWNSGYGGAYATGFSILILGVPYRYLPIYQR